MKLTKTIKLLNKYLNKYGDIDVKIYIHKNGEGFVWDSVQDITANNVRTNPIIKIWG